MTAQDVDVSTSYRQQEAGKADGVTRTTDIEKKIERSIRIRSSDLCSGTMLD